MKSFSEVDLNLKPVAELDRQIMSGELRPVCINDGRIVALEEE